MRHQLFSTASSNSTPDFLEQIDKRVELTRVIIKIRSGLKLGRIFYLFWLFLIVALVLTPASIILADDPASILRSPDRLIIPAIALDSKITPVRSNYIVLKNKVYRQWATSDNLVGWHDLSAQPGDIGNTVLSGHSDIYAQVFRNLKRIEIGDKIMIISGGRKYKYKVARKFLVKEAGASVAERAENGKWIIPSEGWRLTLITCINPGATHRLIVIAHPVFTRIPECRRCLPVSP